MHKLKLILALKSVKKKIMHLTRIVKHFPKRKEEDSMALDLFVSMYIEICKDAFLYNFALSEEPV